VSDARFGKSVLQILEASSLEKLVDGGELLVDPSLGDVSRMVIIGVLRTNWSFDRLENFVGLVLTGGSCSPGIFESTTLRFEVPREIA
jgi:hypothetical protein